MSKIHILTSLALSLGMGLLPAGAQDAAAPKTPPARERDGRMGRRLHLTDAQKAGIQELRKKHRESLATRKAAMKDARIAFRTAAAKTDTPVEELRKLHAKVADLAFDLRMEARALREEVRALLTPEQREEAARMRGRMEGMMMSRRGPWHEGGHGFAR